MMEKFREWWQIAFVSLWIGLEAMVEGEAREIVSAVGYSIRQGCTFCFTSYYLLYGTVVTFITTRCYSSAGISIV